MIDQRLFIWLGLFANSITQKVRGGFSRNVWNSRLWITEQLIKFCKVTVRVRVKAKVQCGGGMHSPECRLAAYALI